MDLLKEPAEIQLSRLDFPIEAQRFLRQRGGDQRHWQDHDRDDDHDSRQGGKGAPPSHRFQQPPV